MDTRSSQTPAPTWIDVAFAPLLRRWREEAVHLRARYCDERLARLVEVHSAELQQVLGDLGRSAVTLAEASALTGYSTSHLRSLIARGDVPNAGRRGRPRLEIGSLPFKGQPASKAVAMNTGKTRFDAGRAAARALRRAGLDAGVDAPAASTVTGRNPRP